MNMLKFHYLKCDTQIRIKILNFAYLFLDNFFTFKPVIYFSMLSKR